MGAPALLLGAFIFQLSGGAAAFTCADGRKSLDDAKVNDDFCDCADGSDEPATSACSGTADGGVGFLCANAGHVSKRVFSSRVNDGICDCCDGSDESASYVPDCSNTCAAEHAKADVANAEANAARMEGLKLRAVYAAKGQTYFSEKNGELAEKEGAHAGLTEQVASLEEQKQQLEALEEQGAAEAALAYDLDIAARLGTAELEADELRLLLVRVLREGAGSVTGLVNTIREKASHPPAEDPLSALLSQSKAEAVTDIATQLRTICTKSAETASTSAKEAGKAADEVKEKKTKAVNLQARLDANVAANQIPAILTMGNNALKAAKTSRKAAQTAKADAVKASATADAALKEANEQWDALEMAKAGSEALRSVQQSKTNADSASKAASTSAASASASLNILNAHFKAIQGVVDAAKSKMRETGQGVPDDEGDDDDDDDEGTEYDEDGNKVESSEGGEDASEETVESGLVAPAVWGEAEAVAELVKVPEEGYKKPEATAAREAHEKASKGLAELASAVESLKQDVAVDYGPDHAFFAFKGECYTEQFGEFEYELCPFGDAKQDHTNLGSWQGFSKGQTLDDSVAPDPEAWTFKWTGGQSCWNGPQRSASAIVTCGLENKLTNVRETETCVYLMHFTSPAVCDAKVLGGSGHQEL